jgi:hypothetical protein
VEFYASERLDPAVGTRLNLGDCEEHRGRIATAWQFFRDAVRELPVEDDRNTFAQQRATALEPRLPKLTIRLARNAPGDTEVHRDGVIVRDASLGRALPVDPGEHRIAVSAPGHARRSLSVMIAEGERKVVDVSPGEVGADSGKHSGGSVSPGGIVRESGSSRKTWGFVVGGVGVTLGVAGAVTGALVLADRSTVDQHCDAQTKRCDDPAAVDAAERGRTLGPVTTVLLLTGAAGIGIGTYLLVTPSSSVEISGQATATEASLSLRRRFW